MNKFFSNLGADFILLNQIQNVKPFEIINKTIIINYSHNFNYTEITNNRNAILIWNLYFNKVNKKFIGNRIIQIHIKDNI